MRKYLDSNIIENTKDMPKYEWLIKRKCGIGGSDASSILGLNPYRSSMAVYIDKIDDENESLEIKGRDMITGLPKVVTITEEQVREALKEPVYAIIESIKTTLEKTPPELAADIIEKGIMLAGGGALLKGLDQLINAETNMPVHIAESPLDCVVLGAGKALENFDQLSKTQRGQ